MDERKKGEMKDFHYVMSFNDNVCTFSSQSKIVWKTFLIIKKRHLLLIYSCKG